MGTLLNRRRYMGGESPSQYNENSYVQDGLVFQLDGIADGGVSGHWIDLKQNGDFTISDTNITKSAYGYIFDSPTTGDPASAYMNRDLINLPYAHLNTIEYVFRDLNAVPYSQEVSLFNTKANTNAGPFLRYQNGGVFFSGKYRYQIIKISNVLKATFAILSDATGNDTTNYGFCNGEKKTLTRQTSGYGAGTYVFIGGIKKASLCVCAIRLYNRRLTDSEILQNQHIDNVRFNLGLSI